MLPHYKAAAKFFNPNLTDEQAETIASSHSEVKHPKRR
jgi:hypothetical protein